MTKNVTPIQTVSRLSPRARLLIEFDRRAAQRDAIAANPRPSDLPALAALDRYLGALWRAYLAAGGDLAEFYGRVPA